MGRISRIGVGLSAPVLALMPLSANAQAFQGLCNVYNTYFSAHSQLIGFGLMIMVVGALVVWFSEVGGDVRPKMAYLFASIPITAGVVLIFPQILGTMGFATC